MGANAHMRPKQQRSIGAKWMQRVADLLASSQRSSHIIWKHYGSVWRTNKMLDIKCLVVIMYWKAAAVFWRNGCAILRAALFCLCVCMSLYFLTLYQRCRGAWDVILLFWPRVANHIARSWSVGGGIFSRIATGARPHELQTADSLPASSPQSLYQLNAEIVFA